MNCSHKNLIRAILEAQGLYVVLGSVMLRFYCINKEHSLYKKRVSELFHDDNFIASSPGPLLFELLGGPGMLRLVTFQKCIAGIDAG